MKKDEFVARYGIAAYEKRMKMSRDWRKAHPENNEKWQEQIAVWKWIHTKKMREYSQKSKRKHRVHNTIRDKYSKLWLKYKVIIAPASRLFHLWIPGSDEHICAALVEKDQHLYPFKDVINKRGFRKQKYRRFLICKCSVPVFTNKQLQAGLTDVEEGGK